MAQVKVTKNFAGESIAKELGTALLQYWKQGLQAVSITAYGAWDFRGRSLGLDSGGEAVHMPVGHKIVRIGNGEGVPLGMTPTAQSLVEVVTIAEGDLVDADDLFSSDDNKLSYFDNRKPRGRKPASQDSEPAE